MVPKENLKNCNKDPTSKQNMKGSKTLKGREKGKMRFIKQIILFP